eukprot:11819691-Ditylum_brightwellii.AAC.1
MKKILLQSIWVQPLVKLHPFVYGLLSLARFLHQIAQYRKQEVKYDIDIYINNKGIVKRIKDQLKYIRDYLLNTLEPDWDIVAQFAHTLKLYGTNLTITHVKSHQDDKVLIDELDLLARFNVATDHLATWYRLQQGAPCMEVPRIVINGTQLCTKVVLLPAIITKRLGI